MYSLILTLFHTTDPSNSSLTYAIYGIEVAILLFGIVIFFLSQLHQAYFCSLLKNPIAVRLQSFFQNKQLLWNIAHYCFASLMTVWLILTAGNAIIPKVLCCF